VKKFKKIIAEVFSRLLDPTVEIPAALFLAVGFAVQEGLRWRFMGLLLFIDAIVPLIFFLTMLEHKQISDWDIQKRTQRLPLYIFTMACHLGGLWLAHELGKTSLTSVLLVYYVVAISFFVITLKWKISLHAGVNAVLITTLNVFTNWKYWWLYGLVLAVMWARVYQKHHTWAQVVAGAALGGLIVGVGLYLSGLGYFAWKD
jgi:membrane-associated phospholipid phosphatase